MPNPLAIAVRGKGIIPMLVRSTAIVRRYGLTANKMDIALTQFLEVLKKYDCLATLPITATAFSRHKTLAQKFHSQGFELAAHGLMHVDYTQLSPEQQWEHFHETQQIFISSGIHPSGFRSPYLRWNSHTVASLQELGFAYDCSQALAWDVAGARVSGSYTRALQFYGARLASQYPSLPWMEGNLVRIPYCLPDDEALVERLKIPPGQAMAEVWLGMLDRIYAAGELFTLGLHPERAPLTGAALSAVLAKARSLSPRVWIARLDQIAAWQRSLGQVGFRVIQEDGDCYRVMIQAPPEAIVLARAIEVEARHQVFGQGYTAIEDREFAFRCVRRPWIGLASKCTPSLKTFLQNQGYLVETGLAAANCSLYLENENFKPEEERALLTELETGERPLIRLARWPSGARAALSVTGDVDAFTLWDYCLRLLNN